MSAHLDEFIRIMQEAGIDENIIKTFSAYYEKLASGEVTLLSKKEISPPAENDLLFYDRLPLDSDKSVMQRIVNLKLNGGLGTSMGLSKAKSLLPVKGNLNFLDIIARQVLTLRAQLGIELPLIFMNSYSTQADTLNYLQKYPDLALDDLPLDFLQNKYPRIRQEDLAPFVAKDEKQRWNPPGHGDIYAALQSSGLLDNLLSKGYKYAFISNSDNLGAVIEASIPQIMQKSGIPFFMEVCLRTEADRKGGHLCVDKNGKLILREIAQCPEDELSDFQDINKYKFFNTNSIWLDLEKLKSELEKHHGILLLPLICNPKKVENVPVYQLETAMGAAISIFEGSKALVVPRSRFAPVKKTNDLLALWSDAYELNEQYQIVLCRSRTKPPKIELDERFYGTIEQMQKRFLEVPSLRHCESLTVSGDITFGRDVICSGNVYLAADGKATVQDRVCEGLISL